ncbi:hypothetical protein GCM10008956_37510 [Deinococcus arenae]|uniref:Uncharacterized protein n=1 Tax=Deinococcus arenae TaxID=1452751 RepID=A0A8H9GTE2_9DEIO|nr:hypothetical protein GCM10008956_37510 [Deinococcus arenae]
MQVFRAFALSVLHRPGRTTLDPTSPQCTSATPIHPAAIAGHAGKWHVPVTDLPGGVRLVSGNVAQPIP